jgi:hypothetical protein
MCGCTLLVHRAMKNILPAALFTIAALFAYGFSNANTPGYNDTLIFKGKTILLQPIDRATFYNLPGPAFNWLDSVFGGITDIDDKKNVSIRDTIIRREVVVEGIGVDSSAKVLTLKFQNGESKKLASVTYEESVGYDYKKVLPELNSYLVCHYFEQYSNYLLYNKTTGKETFLCGYPSVAPNKKLICSYQHPCDGCPVGFECSSELLFYTVDGDSLTLQWESPLTWVPVLCKWKDSRTLYFKIRDQWMEDESHIYYVKLQLPVF